ncbi:cytochrome c class I [[Leptolyngbya] sp. PCC 7376]|uniref:c-type cytochrome n=1 Tax=[Leptolyngbya] sp. PCC 7376 TaxID=111781 RepID=UPI00029F3F64|nr:cytochrome c [[Leptolyngbya] sp. PCC 7376]AFY39577.1 cytochrome c class I [[Leptolyngbya] sp. PCC 7376]
MVNSDNTTSNQPPKLLLVLGLILAIVASGFVGVYASQATSDPYTREVLTLVGDDLQGNAIFQINCAGCHGIQADGNVGPSLKGVTQRKSDSRLIQQVISGNTPPMPKFQPEPEEMADLLSYLHTL